MQNTTSELHTIEVQIYNFYFQKFPVDCDAMIHVLKNFQISRSHPLLEIDVTSYVIK